MEGIREMISAYKNVHDGKAAVLFLTGPTLNDYIEPEPDLIKVGVNTALFNEKLDLDYFFIQDIGKKNHSNSYINKQEEYDSYRPNIAKFYGVTLCKMLRDNVERAGAVPYEFTHGPIIKVNNAKIEDPDIPVNFSENLHTKLVAAGGSIAFPALQFLLWAGVSRIYVVGADITDGRRFNEEKSQDYTSQYHIERWREFEKWVAKAYPDVKIIPLNPIGLKGMFQQKFRMHVLGIPHTITSKEFAHCAFTQKVRRFCKFMSEDGHTIFHYGHERSEVECAEHISVTNDETFNKCYNGNYDWTETSYNCKIGDVCHKEFTTNTIRELKKRFQKRDFILCWYGCGHKAVADAFPNAIVVEPSIGCFRSFSPFRVFESYSVMNFILGLTNTKPRWYDAVIPGFVEPDEFAFQEEKEDWCLYLGRIDPVKGIDVAINTCQRTGMKLKMAGQGKIDNIPSHVEMLGYLDFESKIDYLKRAKALICPSRFNEPFGYIAIEAAMCGTPVISSDWGGFVDTVVHGVTGYRCRNMDQFDWALRNIDKINHQSCRDWAVQNFSIGCARERYTEYFRQVHGVFFGCDFNGSDPSRNDIITPKRIYPRVNT